MSALARGARAELRARRHLEAQGLRTLCTNYRCRWGEIDLVMRDADSLVFVEVRYRARADFGGALASIDARKQRKLARAALHYLQRSHATLHPARFDVVTLTPGGSGTLQVDWLRNAFEAPV